jgi:hypothetical protein
MPSGTLILNPAANCIVTDVIPYSGLFLGLVFKSWKIYTAHCFLYYGKETVTCAKKFFFNTATYFLVYNALTDGTVGLSKAYH